MEDRLAKSQEISRKLFAHKGFRKSKTVLFYASFDGEVDTFEMIKKAIDIGKRICLPKVVKRQNRFVPVLINSLGRDLKKGAYGVLEPRLRRDKVLSAETVDVVIVPGVAFDKQKYRLGRGGGYYDRFLSELPPEKVIIGLAFDFQIVDRLPREPHDLPVSCVITN